MFLLFIVFIFYHLLYVFVLKQNTHNFFLKIIFCEHCIINNKRLYFKSIIFFEIRAFQPRVS